MPASAAAPSATEEKKRKKEKENKPNWFQRFAGNVTEELFGDNDEKM